MKIEFEIRKSWWATPLKFLIGGVAITGIFGAVIGAVMGLVWLLFFAINPWIGMVALFLLLFIAGIGDEAVTIGGSFLSWLGVDLDD